MVVLNKTEFYKKSLQKNDGRFNKIISSRKKKQNKKSRIASNQGIAPDAKGASY